MTKKTLKITIGSLKKIVNHFDFGGIEMRKLQIIGIVVLTFTIIGLVFWRFDPVLPDWFVRVNGLLMLISIFITVFSTAKISMKRR